MPNCVTNGALIKGVKAINVDALYPHGFYAGNNSGIVILGFSCLRNFEDAAIGTDNPLIFKAGIKSKHTVRIEEVDKNVIFAFTMHYIVH